MHSDSTEVFNAVAKFPERLGSVSALRVHVLVCVPSGYVTVFIQDISVEGGRGLR